MPRKSYSEEFKAELVERAHAIGLVKAAREGGVSYQTLSKWMKTETEVGETTEKTGVPTAEQIEKVNIELGALTAALKEKKDELKALQKQLAKEEKAAARKRAAEEKRLAEQEAAKKKDEVLSAIESSGKSLEEILDFLK